MASGAQVILTAPPRKQKKTPLKSLKLKFTSPQPPFHPPKTSSNQQNFQTSDVLSPKTHLRLECFAPAATFFKADPQTCPTWEVRRTLMPYTPGRGPSFSGSILIFKGVNALEIPQVQKKLCWSFLVWPIFDSSCLKKGPNKSIHFHWREVWKAPLSLSHNKMVRRLTHPCNLNMDTAGTP